MCLDNNHPTDITNVEDLQIKEIHVSSHTIDIADQTVKTINTEMFIQDRSRQESFKLKHPKQI